MFYPKNGGKSVLTNVGKLYLKIQRHSSDDPQCADSVNVE